MAAATQQKEKDTAERHKLIEPRRTETNPSIICHKGGNGLQAAPNSCLSPFRYQSQFSPHRPCWPGGGDIVSHQHYHDRYGH